MKHIFIVNPCAGKEDHSDSIRRQLEGLGDGVEWEMYVTRAAGDATRYVQERCAEPHDDTLRFYACGGDGTLNEVLTGLLKPPSPLKGGGVHGDTPLLKHSNIQAFKHSELAAYPCGSGNDYIKYYGTAADFLDLPRLMNGTVREVDVMQVTGGASSQFSIVNCQFSINVCNFGFDALVCKTMEKVRRWPLLGGANAYTTGILRHIVTGRNTPVTMRVDGEPFFDGRILLCTLANGRYVGGQYKCAPASDNADGLLEVNLFRPMSIARFASLIGSYADGTYPSRKGMDRWHRYRRGMEVEIESPRPLYLCVDGEVLCDTRFHIRNLPRAVPFVVPQ